MYVIFIPVFFFGVTYLAKQLPLLLGVILVQHKLWDKGIYFLEDGFVLAFPWLEDNVYIGLSDILLDVEVFGKITSFFDQLWIVSVCEKSLEKTIFWCPSLEFIVLKNFTVFLEDTHHESDPIEFFLKIGTSDQFQGQGQLSLSCPLMHTLLKRCFMTKWDQSWTKVADTLLTEFFQMSLLYPWQIDVSNCVNK